MIRSVPLLPDRFAAERLQESLTAILIFVAFAEFMASCRGPVLWYEFDDPRYEEQYKPHTGVDIKGQFGDPILAMADGKVVEVFDYGQFGCGLYITLQHERFSRYTRYCHLSEALVSEGQLVKRGETIGLMGYRGRGSRVTHIHFELCPRKCYGPDSFLSNHFDPMSLVVGCFDPQKKYSTDRLVLTYPVKCRD